MVLYRLRLGDHEMHISVPKRIKGLNSVARYICKFEAKRYAKGVTAQYPLITYLQRRKRNENNWFDSHLDAITSLLTDLRDKLKDKYVPIPEEEEEEEIFEE